jgi:flagellar motor switch protein FliN/FliY
VTNSQEQNMNDETNTADEETVATAEAVSGDGQVNGQNGQGIERAEFQDLQQGAVSDALAGGAGLGVILDIPVTLSMEIGRTRISIKELLQLGQGSVVELDRLAGEPMDVLVNGTLVARGDVVVVNDKFGIRLSDIVSPAERVNKLG